MSFSVWELDPGPKKIHDTHIKNTYIKIHNLYMTHFVGYITRNLQSKLHARRCRKTKLLLLGKIIVPYQRENLALLAYV